MAQVLAKASRLFHTVRHLRPIQVTGRLAAVLRRVRPDHSPHPPLRPVEGRWGLPAWRAPSMLSPTRFRFLNEEHELADPGDWNNPGWPRLWLYNLHYFDDLDAVNAGARARWHALLVARWIAENPAPLGPGWEPYCLSLRIVNWCRFAWSGGVLAPEAVQSLAVQVRALADQLEVHLLGNHLFANAKALVFAGTFFEGEEADRWLATGLRHLSAELKEQVLADGGHFERSPMYHSIIADDVLELIEAGRLAPGRLSAGMVHELRRVAGTMLAWAGTMSHDDGEVSFFNDSAMGIAPRVEALIRRADRLELPPPPAPGDLERLEASGYCSARAGPAHLIADVGEVGPDYLPGHAHADTLSFELSLHGRRLLVNSGTSTYGTSEQRAWERGSRAHNTVVVDDADSSEVWSSFRVARRARPRDLEASVRDGEILIRAAHDGYLRLPGRVIHTREWRLGPEALVVTDRLEGRMRSSRSYWRLHPDMAVEQTGPYAYRCLGPKGPVAHVHFSGGEVTVETGYWAPEFGVRIPSVALAVETRGETLVSRWTW